MNLNKSDTFNAAKVNIYRIPALMQDSKPSVEPHSGPLPFNNLYLLSGLVHGQNKWWMYVFTVLFLMFGYFTFQLIILFPLTNRLTENGYDQSEIMANASLIFDSDALKLDRNILLCLELGMFVLAFAGFYTGLRYLHFKTLTSVITGFERFRTRRFFFGFAIWGSLILIVTAVSYYFDPKEFTLTFNPVGLFVSFIVLLIFMPLQTGLEEFLFRGYLMQAFSQTTIHAPFFFRLIYGDSDPERYEKIRLSFLNFSRVIFRNGLIPLLLTSSLFALAHMGNPEVKEHGWPIMFSYYGSFALFMGALTLLDEGTELAFGIHFANNLVSALLVTSSHSVLKAHSVFQTNNEDPYSEFLMWSVMAAICFFIFWLRYRWKNFNLILR